jgi:hypothetical protein
MRSLFTFSVPTRNGVGASPDTCGAPAPKCLIQNAFYRNAEKLRSPLTALKRNLLNRANIEQIVHGTFLPTGRRYEQDFTIDDGFGINFLFVEHSDHELLEIEFRPLLPMPKIIDQQSLADYQKRFEEYAPIALKRHCIAQADIAMSLHESGWTWFPTELSSSPDDKSGNVVYFSEDKGFVILTLEDSCLAAIQISTERSYSGTYGKAIVH